MKQCYQFTAGVTRRDWLETMACGFGAVAFHAFAQQIARAANSSGPASIVHHAPKARRVIFLFMHGGVSQVDSFDPKPKLAEYDGKELPFKGIDNLDVELKDKAGNGKLLDTSWKFRRHGESGAWISELLPYTAKIADEISFVKSMTSLHVNHDPAVTFMQTGHQFPGRPSMGAWFSYGLGSLNNNLPDYITLTSQGNYKAAQPLLSRLWGSGFLPSKHQGVKFRSGKNAVFHLTDPAGQGLEEERLLLDALKKLNKKQFVKTGDELIGSQRVPSLRNVAHTAPYMHGGQLKTLKEVIEHYDKAPNAMIGHNEAKPLGLNKKEKKQIIAFLNTLTGELMIEAKWLANPHQQIGSLASK